MFGDRERPARIRAEQDRAVARYIRSEVYPYSDAHRRRFDAAGFARGRVRSRADLATMPLVELDSITDPVPWTLRPDATRIGRHGDLVMRARLLLASALGRRPQLSRGRIDPVFKPVHWTLARNLLIGSSAADLDRLGELGRRWLEMAGVRPTDVVVSLVRPGPSVGFWQLVLGARRAGLSALFLDEIPTAAELAYLRPTTLAGAARDLLEVGHEAAGTGVDLGSIATVLLVDSEFDPDVHRQVRSLFPGGAVVVAWAPPGVRALWSQCRGGGAALHTWPAAEVIEIVDPPTGQPAERGALGDLVWSALEWRGTVLLRLRTGVMARLTEGQCPTCGRTNPRIEPVVFPAVLDAHPAVRAWQVEMRRGGAFADLVVYAALDPGAGPSANGDLTSTLRELDERIGVAQFVVLDQAAVEARVIAHGGARVVEMP